MSIAFLKLTDRDEVIYPLVVNRREAQAEALAPERGVPSTSHCCWRWVGGAPGQDQAIASGPTRDCFSVNCQPFRLFFWGGKGRLVDQEKAGAMGVLLAPMNEDAANWVAAAMLTGVMIVLWLV